jgi:hypothetical protein
MLNWKKCGKVTIAMIPFAAAMVLVATSNPTVIRMQGPCDPATFRVRSYGYTSAALAQTDHRRRITGNSCNDQPRPHDYRPARLSVLGG